MAGDTPVPSAGAGRLWLSVWFTINILVTIMNKAFFKWWGFVFPITLSMVHMICSAIGSYIILRGSGIEMQKLSFKEQLPVMLFSILFCANIVVGNTSLRFVNVSLVQVVRSIIPGITMALSIVILHKHYARAYYYIIALVMVGVALASYGELEFHMLGFLLTLLVCFLSSLKSVMSAKFLVGKLRFHPFELLYRMSSLASLQMAILSFFLESDGVREWWHAHDDQQTYAEVEHGMNHAHFATMVLINGVMAFFLNYSNFMATKNSSALSVTVAGNVKHIVTIVASVIVFANPISFINAVGTTITLIGAAMYSLYDYKLKRAPVTNK